MAVFTTVTPEDALSLLRRYDAGAELLRLEGISSGIENTNYFVTARLHGTLVETVLTLFETLLAQELRYFVNVMNWWSRQDIPVPAPHTDNHGQQIQSLHGKPTLLSPRLAGAHVFTPIPDHCAAIGGLLARMHQSATTAPFSRPVERNIDWMQQQQKRLNGFVTAPTARHLAAEIRYYQRNIPLFARCPSGLVHGDLFRDNVLFSDGNISGLIDFYHSGQEVLLFDLAVVANDWCQTRDHRLNLELLAALLQAYQTVRPWTDEETQAWPHLLRLAALRFWLARLVSRYLPGYQQQSTSGDKTKDPAEMEQLLRNLADGQA